MIPKKNLFSGALGKFKEIGGSRCFSTPHTVDVPVQYSVSTNMIGEFVNSSLDGRLWCIKRSTRYTFFSLKWNSDSLKLEFAASLARNNESILARGLDWILTNKVLVKALDNEPYIMAVNLFTDNSSLSLQEGQNIGHCYSILPPLHEFKIIDNFFTFINQFENINGLLNSLNKFENIEDLISFINEFDDNSVSLDFIRQFENIEDFFAFVNNAGNINNLLNSVQTAKNIDDPLTHINEAYIIENLLIRRDINNNNISLSYIIPLEFPIFLRQYVFNLFNDNYEVTCFGDNIIAHNGTLWGCGVFHIGKCFLLPAVFHHDGTPKHFYLYFQQQFPNIPFIKPAEHYKTTIFNGHLFMLILIPSGWDDAKSYCESLGGHLATSTSEEKNTFLTNFANGNNVFLGGTTKDTRNNWQWVNGEDWIYSNWDSDQPTNQHTQCGLALNTNGKWIDKSTIYSYFYYICEWDVNIDAQNFIQDATIAPAFLGNNLYGYKFNSGHNLCSMSNDNYLLNSASGEWTAISEHNGNIFFDINRSKGILLDDKGSTFLNDNNTRFDCNVLRQWLAPADSVDALDDNMVVSSGDNLSVITHPDLGFMREVMHNKVLPLSSPLGNGYRFSLGISDDARGRKNIIANQINSNSDKHSPLIWNNIYKQAVDFKLVNVLHDVRIAEFVTTENRSYSLDVFAHEMQSPFFLQNAPTFSFLIVYDGFSITHISVDSIFSIPGYDPYRIGENNYLLTCRGSDYSRHSRYSDSYLSHDHGYVAVITEISANVYYFNPVNGAIEGPIPISAHIPYEFNILKGDKLVKMQCKYRATTIQNGRLGFCCEKITYDINTGRIQNNELIFIPALEPADDILNKLSCWANSYDFSYLGYAKKGIEGIILDKLFFQSDSPDEIIDNNLSKVYTSFYETSSGIRFSCDLSNIMDAVNIVSTSKTNHPSNYNDYFKSYFFDSATLSDNRYHVLNSKGKMKFLNNLHFVFIDHVFGEGLFDPYLVPEPLSKQYDSFKSIYIFRSQLQNDIFDFEAELKRSVHS